jgi:PKHD-type hydroxylase
MIYPIPNKPTFGKDSFAYWENFLSNEEINLLLAQPEWLTLNQGCVGGSSDSLTTDKNIRSSLVSWLNVKQELLPIWSKLADVVAEVNSRYFHFDITGFHEPMQISAYTEFDHGHYNWHTDSASSDRNVPRKLSLAILLSDPSEFEGGEFQIKSESDIEKTLECKKGRAWFFPSYTLHRVTPVTKGIRRSLVLWVGGPQFR